MPDIAERKEGRLCWADLATPDLPGAEAPKGAHFNVPKFSGPVPK